MDGTQAASTSFPSGITAGVSSLYFTARSADVTLPGFDFSFTNGGIAFATDTSYDCSMTSLITYYEDDTTTSSARTGHGTCLFNFSTFGDLVGDRVIGTFSATLVPDLGGASVEATDGSFHLTVDN